MPRPAGLRNTDFDQKRMRLIERLTSFALAEDQSLPSFRQFAIAAETSEPTLRHYFGDRNGLVIEIMREIGARAEPLWAVVATGATDPKAAVQEYLTISEGGIRHGGFLRAHVFGLVEGLHNPDVALAYRDFILNPALNIVETKLKATQGGPEDKEDTRTLAYLFLAPLLVHALYAHLGKTDGQADLSLAALVERLKIWLADGANGAALR